MLVSEVGAFDAGTGGIVAGVARRAGQVFHLFTLVELGFLLLGQGIVEGKSGLVHATQRGFGLAVVINIGGGLGAQVGGCEGDGTVVEGGIDTDVVAAELHRPCGGVGGVAKECNVVLGVAEVCGTCFVVEVLVDLHDAGDFGVGVVVEQGFQHFERGFLLFFVEVAELQTGALDEGDGEVRPRRGFSVVVVVVEDFFFLLIAQRGQKFFGGGCGGVNGFLCCRRRVGRRRGFVCGCHCGDGACRTHLRVIGGARRHGEQPGHH